MELQGFSTFRIAVCDLNGLMRGKRLTALDHPKLATDQIRMPLSALNVDLWGCDIDESPLVFKTGDADGFLRPTERGLLPMPWLTQKSALVPMWMFNENGTPFSGDPRHALAQVLDRFAKRGWQVIAATELEFYLVDDSGSSLLPVINPTNKRRLNASDTLSLQQLDDFDAFFSDLYQSCDTLGIAAQTATSECGVGQFEMSISHCDAMRMADDTWLFKTLVKGLARKHGMAATFMAKPFMHDAGNGLHIHFSVLDEDGRNIFDDGSESGSELLRYAVAGCLSSMQASTLAFAPYENSYLRLIPGAHAPTNVCWAYENRTVAIRIPAGNPKARRIEHRVAGGDINPYLMISLVLGAAMVGIEDEMIPPEPINGNAYDQTFDQLALDLASAISSFETDPVIARILPGPLIENFSLTKRQEATAFGSISADKHWETSLEKV